MECNWFTVMSDRLAYCQSFPQGNFFVTKDDYTVLDSFKFQVSPPVWAPLPNLKNSRWSMIASQLSTVYSR